MPATGERKRVCLAARHLNESHVRRPLKRTATKIAESQERACKKSSELPTRCIRYA